MSMLAAAIERVAAFRKSFKDGDVIDANSRLTVDDLDSLLTESREPDKPIVMGARE